jgi:hypothetical protein
MSQGMSTLDVIAFSLFYLAPLSDARICRSTASRRRTTSGWMVGADGEAIVPNRRLYQPIRQAG